MGADEATVGAEAAGAGAAADAGGGGGGGFGFFFRGLFADAGEGFAAGDLFAEGLEGFGEDAVLGGVDLQGDFVGFHDDDDIAFGDGVAGLFPPFQDGRFRNGFGEFGDFDFNHDAFFLRWKIRDGCGKGGNGTGRDGMGWDGKAAIIAPNPKIQNPEPDSLKKFPPDCLLIPPAHRRNFILFNFH